MVHNQPADSIPGDENSTEEVEFQTPLEQNDDDVVRHAEEKAFREELFDALATTPGMVVKRDRYGVWKDREPGVIFTAASVPGPDDREWAVVIVRDIGAFLVARRARTRKEVPEEEPLFGNPSDVLDSCLAYEIYIKLWGLLEEGIAGSEAEPAHMQIVHHNRMETNVLIRPANLVAPGDQDILRRALAEGSVIEAAHARGRRRAIEVVEAVRPNIPV